MNTGTAAARGAVPGLGIVQCVYWGVLYYTFAVVLVPMQSDLGASPPQLAGAFTLGLALSALLATAVGRALDRGLGARLVPTGGWLAALLLWAWSEVQSLSALYTVWAGLGACMAMVLYESAFALVTRAIAEPAARLSALAQVTVLGGLASTVFLPLVGSGVDLLGWRDTLKLLLGPWVLATAWLQWRVLPGLLAPAARGQAAAGGSTNRVHAHLRVGATWRLVLPFAGATFAAMAVTTLLVPVLVQRGTSVATAATVLAAFGLAQLPGRLWMWRGARRLPSMHALLLIPLLLQAAGLLLLTLASGLIVVALAVALFGLGAGLHTLVRPWLVPALVGAARAGVVNGGIARAQGVARAAGPLLAAAALSSIGGAMTFFVLACGMLLLSPFAASTARLAAQRELELSSELD